MTDLRKYEDFNKAATRMSEAAMADSIAMMMQNAATVQKSMQTMTNTAVSTACTMILAKGGGG